MLPPRSRLREVTDAGRMGAAGLEAAEDPVIPAPVWVGVTAFLGICALYAMSRLALRYLEKRKDNDHDEHV